MAGHSYQNTGAGGESDGQMSPSKLTCEAGVATQAQTDRLGQSHEQHDSKAWRS